MAYKPAYVWNGSSFDQIGNQAVASLDSYALLAPVVAQTISNTVLNSASVNNAIVTSASMTGGVADSLYFVSPGERITVNSASATGALNFDFTTQAMIYYTLNSASNVSLNFRGNASTTLNSIMFIGESLSGVFMMTNGATAYYVTSILIDGSVITPKWSAGTVPTNGNANSIDVYSFTIIKTANNTFTVFASTGRFA